MCAKFHTKISIFLRIIIIIIRGEPDKAHHEWGLTKLHQTNQKIRETSQNKPNKRNEPN